MVFLQAESLIHASSGNALGISVQVDRACRLAPRACLPTHAPVCRRRSGASARPSKAKPVRRGGGGGRRPDPKGQSATTRIDSEPLTAPLVSSASWRDSIAGPFDADTRVGPEADSSTGLPSISSVAPASSGELSTNT